MNDKEYINYLEKGLEIQKQKILELEKELAKKNEYINNLPQLSRTSIGKSIFGGKIVYRNWWTNPSNDDDDFCENQWFSQFLLHHFPDADYKINMFSIFGEHYNITEPLTGKKVLFSGENLNKLYTHFNKKFGPYALNYVDLAMGYDLIDHPQYFRFPLWILYNFPPHSNKDTIKQIINMLNNIKYEKHDLVALVSSHDAWNTRKLIADDIEKIVPISYGGKWRNNTFDLWNKFDDNKYEFLKQFKFNICPENTLDDGYVSEKIFHSIQCDCIPLYAGGGKYLEPKVLNKNSILVWDFNKDNSDTVELFKTLISDEKSYNDFKNQDILLKSSSKYIINKFNNLKKHFEKLIYD